MVRAVTIVLLLVGLALGYVIEGRVGGDGSASDSSEMAGRTTHDAAAIHELFRAERSDVVVVVQGRVQRVLEDDTQGSRHQRFIVRVADPYDSVSDPVTLLVAHNIDLAPRVPLESGDELLLRGEYEWNDRGGVLHWTHHDPDGDRPGGWIELDGERYR